ncbi:phosphotransferase family protein [Benzoatithermus flavus]|uniref:Aminoglycoside phosphotransferase family protein n=1 Tax=Benzoatithermus flavus TaxID=3108223 RepID=A0ABU8XST6_9PROT
MGPVPNDILTVLRRAAMVALEEEPPGEPLIGGVSSDIWRVELADGRSVCVKRALARLKVKADWRAPVERSGYEAAWIRVARGIEPAAAPELLFMDEAAGAIVMPYLPSERHRLWKEVLRAGEVDPLVAAAVGERLAAIHAGTARSAEIAAAFPTDAIFHDIRLEPYLLATARAHPALRPELERIARRTATTKLALVHGDISPKNILLGPEGPIFLDAECAWYGDPAFDLAFCLNHLLLKCLWTPMAAPDFLLAFDALASRYLEGVVWEPRAELESRAAGLLPGLFLARIDGKSPVEYVTAEADKERVRRVASTFLQAPSPTLTPIREAWAEELGL